MGACPTPTSSIFFSIISLIPYFIIFYLTGITIFQRKISLIRLTSMLVVAYVIGDKILKNIFRSIYLFLYFIGERPPFSCKYTYGMPSSHMTVMVAASFYLILNKNLNILLKIGLVMMCYLQGMARIELHYHTLEQVIGGATFGIIFSFLYFRLFDTIWSKISKNISDLLPIVNDM